MSFSGPLRRDGRTRSWSHEALVSLPARTLLARQSSCSAAPCSRWLLVALVVSLVWFDRDSYTDNYDGTVSLIDAIYYATVTITTTGYGDITPVSPHARIINAIVVTPLRIAVPGVAGRYHPGGAGQPGPADVPGRTLEEADAQSRRGGRLRHQGPSAVETLEVSGMNPAQVVIIDGRPSAISDANLRGYAAIEGDATRREILRRAEIIKAREVIITLDRDDSAILVMLTVRQLNPSAHVVVAVREDDNASLLRQSGANAVVTSSEAVGRLLGLSAVSPNLGIVIEDLLSSREGLEVGERPVTKDEIGMAPSEVAGDRVIAVVRNKTLRRFYDPTVAHLEGGDQVVVVRQALEER